VQSPLAIVVAVDLQIAVAVAEMLAAEQVAALAIDRAGWYCRLVVLRLGRRAEADERVQ
jgi:hypothetical protein